VTASSATLTGNRDEPSGATAYAWYVSVVFAVFYALSFVDRQVIAILVSPMKSELELSDLQISYLGGLSFVTFYVLFGLVMGRLVDTYNRKRILWVSIVIWTFATTLSAGASRFWQLLILRMGVGLGESVLGPCTYSMLADMFPRHRLATAISVACTGAAVGAGLAYLGGAVALGWATDLAGTDGYVELPLIGMYAPWRVVFLAVGIPGLLLSAILLTIREPRRGGVHASASPAKTAAVPVSEVFAYACAHWRVYAFLYLGIGFVSINVYGGGLWDIVFFERRYGWSPARSGIYYGFVVVIAQMIGSLCGGLVADYLSKKRSRDMKVAVLAAGAFICIGFRAAYPFMPSFETALMLIAPAVFLTAAPFGILAAAVQLVSPVNMRGQMSALYALVQGMVGMGVGPTLVAFFTEEVFRDLNKIGHSLAITGTIAQSIATVLFLLAVKPYRDAVERDKPSVT
jgi:MFS family permease